MADVVIDIPMDGEEVVRCFNFEEKRYMNLRFGSDQIGLQFNNPTDNNNDNNTNINNTNYTTNTKTNEAEDKPASEETIEDDNKLITNTNDFSKQLLLYTPTTNSPILRHKLDAKYTYTRRIPTNRHSNHPNFLGAARRLHKQAVDNGQHQLEMDRLTHDFKSKIKVNRKKKIEMRTFKKAVMDLDM